MNRRDRSDIERRLASMIAIGEVSQVDHEMGRYRVKVGGNESDWIASAVSRSAGTRTYESRDVGEQVILACPSGDLSQGVIIGALATEERQAGTKGSEHRTVYPDGTTVDYDDETHAYKITVPEGGGAVSVSSGGTVDVEGGDRVNVRGAEGVRVESSQAVEVDGAQGATIRGGGATMTLANGRVDVDGANIRIASGAPIEFDCPDVIHNGRSIGAEHRHINVQSGNSTSGPPEG